LEGVFGCFKVQRGPQVFVFEIQRGSQVLGQFLDINYVKAKVILLLFLGYVLTCSRAERTTGKTNSDYRVR